MLSERVCQSCARKVQNAVELHKFIESALNQNTEQQLSPSNTAQISPRGGSGRFKRLLPTSVPSPERSPQPKKGRKKNGNVRKTLTFIQADVSSSPNENNDTLEEEICHEWNIPLAEIHLNVEDLIGKQATELKVVVVNPGGRVENYCFFNDKTKSMVLNLCRKNGKTVASLTFQHPHVREELCEPLRKAVSGEFKEYCTESTDSVLQKSSPEDLALAVALDLAKILVHEAEVWCPLWMCCVKGICNVSNLSRDQENKRKTVLPCQQQSPPGVEINKCLQFPTGFLPFFFIAV